MCKIISILIATVAVVGIFSFSASAQVWKEAFDDRPDGATSDTGPTAWTTTLPTGGASSFSKQTPYPGYGVFLVNNTGTEGTWTTQTINISSYTEIAIEITLYSYFTYSTDYIRCYYVLNGGSPVQFGELLGSNGLSITSAASAIVSGSTLQIIIKANENTAGSQPSGYPNAMGFDDITLSNLTVLYSISNGNWGSNGTWSTTGFTGSSCTCTPDANSRVIVGNGNTVSINAAGNTSGITVNSGSTLRFTSNSALTMDRGGSIKVNSGGTISMNGNSSSSISYGAYSYSVVVDGNLSTGDITTTSGSNITFSGSGSISLGDDFTVSGGNGRTITNNVSGGFTVGGDLIFNTNANTTFTNQQPLTVTGVVNFSTTNIALTNSSTINAGSISVAASTNSGNKITNNAGASITVGAITPNNANFVIDNNGTITQTGNFNTVGTSAKFNNLAGSTWNFSGSTSSTRIFCSTSSNTFAYSAAGNQTITIPADGSYYNLSLAGSGTKTLSAATDINGDLSIGGSAQLDASSTNYALTVAGNWTVTSSNSDPFNERTGSVTFDGTSTQTLKTGLAGGETFRTLVVNKSGGNVQLNATDATVTALTLTSGGLDLNSRTLTINSSSTTAIARTNGFIVSESSSAPYGQLKWTIGLGTGSYVFPFGKTTAASDYIPFTFNITTAGVGVTGTVSVSTYGTGSANTPYPTTVTNLAAWPTNTNNSANVVDRFWYITLANYTTNPTATVTFVATATEAAGISNMKAQRWNGSSWDAPKSGQTNTATSTTVPGVNQFSPWTLSGNSTVLPISLLYFQANLRDDVVHLEWKSASEINNSVYTVEKTKDLETFYEVGKIDGAGTTKEAHLYAMADEKPDYGVSYYRLKQTDYDGNVTYFNYVEIENENNTSRNMSVFPVPLKGSPLTIQITGTSVNEDIPFVIVDSHGNKVYQGLLTGSDDNKVTQTLALAESLPPGIYMIKAGRDLSLTKKIIVD